MNFIVKIENKNVVKNVPPNEKNVPPKLYI